MRLDIVDLVLKQIEIFSRKGTWTKTIIVVAMKVAAALLRVVVYAVMIINETVQEPRDSKMKNFIAAFIDVVPLFNFPFSTLFPSSASRCPCWTTLPWFPIDQFE